MSTPDPTSTLALLASAFFRTLGSRVLAAFGFSPHRRAERFTPDPALERVIEQMRFEADPLADRTVERLFQGGPHEIAGANELLRYLIRNEPVPENLLQDRRNQEALGDLQAYLKHCQTLPPWADLKLIDRAGDLFAEHGMLAFSVLGCASLPIGYAAPEAARVLVFTQQLTEHAQRRLTETATFLVDVMSKGGLEPGGRGLQDIARVRLMHASIQHLLLHKPAGAVPPPAGAHRDFSQVLAAAPWDTALHGAPIHQDVMCATILCFSFVALRSLRHMGLRPTPEAEHAFLHTWNVVGHLMGVREELLLPRPETYAAGEKLFNHIWQRFRAREPYADGIQLTAALLQFLEGSLQTLPHPLPRLPRILMRDLIGQDLTRILGVELGFWDEVVLGVVLRGVRRLDHLEGAVYQDLSQPRLGAEFLFRRMVEALAGTSRGGSRQPFGIPDHLAQKWHFRPGGAPGAAPAAAPGSDAR